MSRKLHTIVLQEEEIARMKKRNRELERGYLSICHENAKLRRQIAKLKRQENGLNKVNI